MKKLLIVVTITAVFLSFTPATWAEDVIADTPYEPYEFESTKPWGIAVKDDGEGFCRVYLTMSRVESSFVELTQSFPRTEEYYGVVPGYWDWGDFQNPASISAWFVYGIKKWKDDNPEKTIVHICPINTGAIPPGDGGAGVTSAVIILYE